MSYTNSPKQSSSSHGSASQQYIKIVEQLIDSDEDEQILKRITQLQTSFPVLKKMTTNITNQQKLTLFLRDHIFRMRLADKLRQSNYLFAEPIVKVHLYTIRHRCQVSQEFNQHDIETVFEKFGHLETLLFNKNQAFFRYDSHISCYSAIQVLNEFEINDTLRLSVKWCDGNDLITIAQHYAASVNNASDVALFLHRLRRSMARYEVYLEISSDFEVPRKIIGHKGGNMKRILTSVLEKHKITVLNGQNSVAKLRLRGKGSGFKDSWNHAESEEQLTLCVSSKDIKVFNDLCNECEKLLLKIGSDYKLHYFDQHHKQSQGIIYRKYTNLNKTGYEFAKQLNLEEIGIDVIDSPAAKKKIKEKQILRLIGMREKAKRQGRYAEADDIRSYLLKENVLLIDDKMTRGKQFKTTWRFL